MKNARTLPKGATWTIGTLVLLLLGFVLGCSAATDDEVPAPDAAIEAPAIPTANAPFDSSRVTKVIGSEGGELAHPAGAKIVVPPGALAGPQELSIEGAPAPAVESSGAQAAGQAFLLGPEGQTFLKTVQVTVPWKASAVPAGTDAADLRLYIAPQGTTDFTALDTTMNLASGSLTGETAHFSIVVAALSLTRSPLFILTKSPLPGGVVGTPYTPVRFGATGGMTPYAWAVSLGALPAGLVLATTGDLNGTPTAAAKAQITVRVTDAKGNKVEKGFSIAIDLTSNPLPVITALDPNAVEQGAATTTIVINGSGFVPASEASWNGTALTTIYLSATQLQAVLAAGSLATAGKANVTVTNPGPGGGTSGAVTFTIDGVPDAGLDASLDAPADTGSKDAAVEASVEAGVDAAAEAQVEAGVDAAAEAQVEAGVDAAVEAAADGGPQGTLVYSGAPQSLAIDDTKLYVGLNKGDPMYGGSIIALDRTSLGSPPTVLATGLSGPGRVRADGSYVYFCDNTGLLSKVNVSGTPVTTNLATAYTNAQTLSVANGWICWPDADMSSGRFVRCAPTDPDAGSALTLYSTSVLVRDVATDGTTVYWVLADGSLYEKSIAAGEAGTATMIDNFSATRLELGSSGLLYLSSAGVYNLSLSTFVPQQLVPVASPVDLQPWVDFVYFTTASSVYQGNAYVAGPGTLLGSYGNVTQVAGDGSQVFFVTNGRQVRQAN